VVSSQHRKTPPQGCSSPVRRRKVVETGSSSTRAEQSHTILVGTVPCNVLAETSQPMGHLQWPSGEAGVRQTVEGPIEEKSKKPRLISAEGREIVGPAFSPKPVLGMEKLAGQCLGKEPEGYTGKRTVDPRMVPASRWCSPGLT
jgi:hypothetical protein